MSYKVPAVNLPYLERELERINKRRANSGLPPAFLKITDEIAKPCRNRALGFDYDMKFYLCDIDGIDFSVPNEWSLVAVVEPVTDNECLIREVPGQICPPEYRVTDLHCDHCHQIRKRNEVYVLKHTDGKILQVGGTCLSEFFGGLDVAPLLKQIESFRKIDLLYRQSYNWGIDTHEIVVPIHEFVCVVSVLSRTFGWTSRSEARDEEKHTTATADRAWLICTQYDNEWVKNFIQIEHLAVLDSDLKLAKEAIDWAASIDPLKAPSTYLHDLGVSCRQPVVTFKRAGYVASVLVAYRKHCNEQIARSVSQYVGVKGERQFFENLRVVLVKPYETAFGQKVIIKLVDDQNNMFVWRTTRCPDWAIQSKMVTVKATVKDHKEYDGHKETELSRVDVH